MDFKKAEFYQDLHWIQERILEADSALEIDLINEVREREGIGLLEAKELIRKHRDHLVNRYVLLEMRREYGELFGSKHRPPFDHSGSSPSRDPEGDS